MLGLQMIHFDVNVVAQYESRRAVEHAQTLGHVVKRCAEQSCLLAAPVIDQQSFDRRQAERERQGEYHRRHRARCFREHGDDPGCSAKRENGNAKRETDNAGNADKRPVAAQL